MLFRSCEHSPILVEPLGFSRQLSDPPPRRFLNQLKRSQEIPSFGQLASGVLWLWAGTIFDLSRFMFRGRGVFSSKECFSQALSFPLPTLPPLPSSDT